MLLKLLIIFTIDWQAIISNKCPRSGKNAGNNFPEPKVVSSDGFVCPANSLKHKDSSFTITNDKESSKSWHSWSQRQQTSEIPTWKMKQLVNYKNCWQFPFDWILSNCCSSISDYLVCTTRSKTPRCLFYFHRKQKRLINFMLIK